jgi:hypothetical protein
VLCLIFCAAVAFSPPCIAPDCLRLDTFARWCRANATDIYGLRYNEHVPSMYEPDFFSASHIIATDVDGKAIRCARLTWDHARNLADIESFRAALLARTEDWATGA